MNMVILGYSIPFWKCQSCAIGARPCIALSSTRHIPWKATSCPRPCHGFPQAPPIRSGVWRPTSNPRVLGGFPGSTSQKSAWKWAKMECSCIKTNQTYRQQHAHDISWSNGWPVADGQRLLVKVALLLQRSKSTATTSSLGSGAWDCHTETPKFGAGTAPTSAENVARSQDMEEADKRFGQSLNWQGKHDSSWKPNQTYGCKTPPDCAMMPLSTSWTTPARQSLVVLW